MDFLDFLFDVGKAFAQRARAFQPAKNGDYIGIENDLQIRGAAFGNRWN